MLIFFEISASGLIVRKLRQRIAKYINEYFVILVCLELFLRLICRAKRQLR